MENYEISEETKPYLHVLLPDNGEWLKSDVLYVCDTCYKVFVHHHLLVEHRQTHAQKGRNLIPMNKTYDGNCEKSYHATMNHVTENKIVCDIKDDGLCKSKMDEFSDENTECIKNTAGRQNKDQITNKKQINVKTTYDAFRCAQCDKSFPNKTRLKTHIKTYRKSKQCKTTAARSNDEAENANIQLTANCDENQIESTADKRNTRHTTAKQKATHKPFKCIACGKSFSDEGNVLENCLTDLREGDSGNVDVNESSPTDPCYVENNETNSKTDRCINCRKKSTLHMKKLKSRKLYQCPHCQSIFFESNRTNHSQCREENEHKCRHCHQQLPALVDLRAQIMAHAEQTSYQCVVCDKSYATKSKLFEHTWRHCQVKPHQCDHCEMSFVEKYKLVQHLRVHSGEKPFKCEICDKAFPHKGGLDVHRRRHTGEKPFQCNICGGVFTDRSYLNYHMLSHSSEKPHTCSECGKGFAAKFELKRHMRVHTGEKPYQCTICGKSFARSKGLSTHMEVHNAARKYKCNTCDKAFTQRSALTRHMLIHTGEKPHECSQCHKRFMQRPHLKKHMTFSCPFTKRKGGELFNCAACSALFTEESRLQEHALLHKNDFSCNLCNAKYPQEKQLRDHLKKHKTCLCTLCNKSFTTQSALNEHMTVKHSGDKVCSQDIRAKDNRTSIFDDDDDDYNDGDDDGRSESNSIIEDSNDSDEHDICNFTVQTPKHENTKLEESTSNRNKAVYCQEQDTNQNLKNNGVRTETNSAFDNSQTADSSMRTCTNKELASRTVTNKLIDNAQSTQDAQCPQYMQYDNTEVHADNDTCSTSGTIDYLISALDLENTNKQSAYDSDTTIDIDLSSLDPDSAISTEAVDKIVESDCSEKFPDTDLQVKDVESSQGNEKPLCTSKSTSDKYDAMDVSTCNIRTNGSEDVGHAVRLSGEDAVDFDASAVEENKCTQAATKIQNSKGTRKAKKKNTEIKSSVAKSKGRSKKCNNRVLHRCPQCNKMFSRVKPPKEPDGAISHQCPHCQVTITKLVDFKTELYAVKDAKSYQCFVCDKSFRKKRDVIRHAWTHSDIKPHQCDHCEMSFVEKYKLVLHLRVHSGEKPFKCEICDKAFPHKGGLDIHRRTHTGEKPFQCNICGGAFTDQSYFKYHMLSHSGEKPHKCGECGKRFVVKFELMRHMRVHTGEKPYKCKQCGKSFAHSKRLHVHMVTHSGVRKHKCDACNKTFTQRCALKRHMLIHTGEKPHECNQCGKRFIQKPHLNKHLKYSCPSS